MQYEGLTDTDRFLIMAKYGLAAAVIVESIVLEANRSLPFDGTTISYGDEGHYLTLLRLQIGKVIHWTGLDTQEIANLLAVLEKDGILCVHRIGSGTWGAPYTRGKIPCLQGAARYEVPPNRPDGSKYLALWAKILDNVPLTLPEYDWLSAFVNQFYPSSANFIMACATLESEADEIF